MDEKKIFQQKILTWVLLFCSATILIASYLDNRMKNTTGFAIVFLIIGVLTMRRVRKAEEQLKN